MEDKKIISGALVLAALLLVLSTIAYAELTPPLPGASTYVNVDAEKAHEMLAKNPEQIILLDVRTEGEYNAEYIPVPGVELINLPLDKLETEIGKLNKSKAVIVYCKSGSRSRTASEILAQHGFIVYNLLGGINAWKENFATSTSTPMPAAPTPTLTPGVTPSPAVSPAFTPTASPTPLTSPILTPTPEKEKRIPGFEASLAIMILLIVFMLLRRKRR